MPMLLFVAAIQKDQSYITKKSLFVTVGRYCDAYPCIPAGLEISGNNIADILANEGGSINLITSHFEKYMKSDSCFLLKSFDNYQRSLPIRIFEDSSGNDECLQLFRLKYLVSSSQLTSLAKTMLQPLGQGRKSVKYMVGPGESGKTSSVLAAFLQCSGKFSHYFYIAFFNNHNNDFKLSPFKPDPDENVARKQGVIVHIRLHKNAV